MMRSMEFVLALVLCFLCDLLFPLSCRLRELNSHEFSYGCSLSAGGRQVADL